MQLTAQIKEIKQDRIKASGEHFFDVCVQFFDKKTKKLHVEKRLGFPIESTEEEITSEISKHARMLESEAKSAADEKVRVEAEKKVDTKIKGLTGKEIK